MTVNQIIQKEWERLNNVPREQLESEVASLKEYLSNCKSLLKTDSRYYKPMQATIKLPKFPTIKRFLSTIKLVSYGCYYFATEGHDILDIKNYVSDGSSSKILGADELVNYLTHMIIKAYDEKLYDKKMMILTGLLGIKL